MREKDNLRGFRDALKDGLGGDPLIDFSRRCTAVSKLGIDCSNPFV